MTGKIGRLNNAAPDEAEAMFIDCCGSSQWARAMAEARPFNDLEEMQAAADEIWNGLDGEDWLEAFAAHPKIGSRKPVPSQKERAAGWSKNEQSGTAGAFDAVLAELEEANSWYERRFGYIFIVCATGRSADEMLKLLRERLENAPEAELKIAAAEQSKITKIRLEKLFG